MSTFISAIYINTNNTSSEKLCIGLIAVSESKVYFEKSNNKISTAISLLKENIAAPIKNSLKLIEKHINEYNIELSGNKLFKNNFLSKEHFGYLANYSQGLIQFMEPKPFAGNLNEKEFEKLFTIFVGDTIKVKEDKAKVTSLKHTVNEILKKETFKTVDVNYEVPANKIPFVKAPITIDMIYKNGAIISANVIDFNASPGTILNHYNEYLVFSIGLDSLGSLLNLSKSQNKIIAEPPQKGTEQEDIYYSIKEEKNSPLEIATPDFFNEIEKKLADNQHQKFSEFLEKI